MRAIIRLVGVARLKFSSKQFKLKIVYQKDSNHPNFDDNTNCTNFLKIVNRLLS